MAAIDLLRATKEADLRRRLRNAKERERRAKAEIDEIESELTWMAEQEMLDLIKSWRGVPDWSTLLISEQGMALYGLANFMLGRMGLWTSNMWSDTKQIGIAISVAAKEDAGEAVTQVANVREAIEKISPHVLPHDDDGRLWFIVNGESIENCAVELRVSPDLSDIHLVTLHFGQIIEDLPFSVLGEALYHIQTEYPGMDMFEDQTDPSHAPGYSGEMLRLALTAFIEGCRSAGLPIDDLNVAAEDAA
jgi:hypothetical protein